MTGPERRANAALIVFLLGVALTGQLPGDKLTPAWLWGGVTLAVLLAWGLALRLRSLLWVLPALSTGTAALISMEALPGLESFARLVWERQLFLELLLWGGLGAWLVLAPRLRGEWLRYLGIILSSWGLVESFFRGEPWGWVANPSLHGCLLALLLPWQRGEWGRVLLLAAMAQTRATMPWVTLVAVVFAMFWAERVSWRWLVGVLVVGVAGAFAIPDFLGLNGRDVPWQLLWNQWTNVWLGEGLGAAKLTLLASQKGGGEIFLTAHNDWLELAFNQGILGVLAWLLIGVSALDRTRRRPRPFAFIVGYGVAMVGNHINHVLIFPVLLAIVLAESYRGSDEV